MIRYNKEELFQKIDKISIKKIELELSEPHISVVREEKINTILN